MLAGQCYPVRNDRRQRFGRILKSAKLADLNLKMLGVRRTTLTLIARNLQAAGLIRYRRGNIEILDRDGLEAKACECYAIIRRRGEEVFSQADA